MGIFSKPTARLEGDEAARERSTQIRKAEIELLLQDLIAGAEYQQATLPPPPQVPNYEFGCYYRGARNVSGDFYDFIPLPQGKLGIAVADASGKGVPAAILTMCCRTLLRAQPEPSASSVRALANVNRMLHGNIKQGMFVSALYAVLDPVRHIMLVANAGHLPLVVWRARPKICTVYPSKGPILGVVPPAAYEAALKEETVILGPGDRFVFITDGVNEAMAPGEKELGMEHLRRRLQQESDAPTGDFLKHVVDTIEIHRAGGEQSDDITIVTGRRLA